MRACSPESGGVGFRVEVSAELRCGLGCGVKMGWIKDTIRHQTLNPKP